jgi:hypothetical protein
MIYGEVSDSPHVGTSYLEQENAYKIDEFAQ